MKIQLTAMIFISICWSACVSTGKYNVLEAEARRYQREVKSLGTKAVEYSNLLEQAKRDIDSLKTLIREHENEITALTAKLKDLQANNDQLMNAINAQDSEKDQMIAGLTAYKQQFENQIVDYEQEIQRLNGTVDELQKRLDDIVRDKETAIKNMATTYNDLVSKLQSEIQDGQIQITQLQDKLSVNIVEKILFDTGKADVKKEGQNILARVAPIMKELKGQQIRIEGHTDNVSIGKALQKTFPSNWELSTTRATNVVRYLTETLGVDPRIISATGYSEFHPIETNTTEEGKAFNRRIEIVVVPIDVDRVVKSKIYE